MRGRKAVDKTVRVEIFDQSYHLRGEMDEPYAQELARHVDQKMREIAAGTRTVDTVRVAVLAAVHMADEVFTLRTRQKELEGEIRDRAERCLTLVDQTLKQSA